MQQIQKLPVQKAILEKNKSLLQKIQKIEDNLDESSQDFIDQLLELFKQINSLALPLRFKKTDRVAQILLFGEMGNGKSTTGNHLIKQILKSQNKKPKLSQQFESKKSLKAVTTQIDIKQFEQICFIDSPGFNDIERSDLDTFQQIIDSILNKALDYGIASLLQCVMVPQAGRIQASAYKLMSRMLQTFTLSYPDSKNYGPKIFVIFTNFSKNFDPDQEIDSQYFDYESDNEKQIDSNQNNQGQQKDKASDPISFENLIKQFKDNMIVQIQTDQQISFQNAQKIVNQIFKDENFFCFKLEKKKDKMDKEMQEIERIINQSIEHGSYSISNINETHMLPINISNDYRDKILQQIQEKLDFCQNKINKAYEVCQNVSSIERLQQIEEIKMKNDNIQKQFKSTILKKPYSLMKANYESIRLIISALKKFELYCIQLCQKEQNNFDIEETKMLKADIQQMQTQNQDDYDQEYPDYYEESYDDIYNRVFERRI